MDVFTSKDSYGTFKVNFPGYEFNNFALRNS